MDVKDKIYIVGGKRTPFGKFGGELKEITPVDLAVYASKAALEECKIKAEQIDHVILGNVVPSSTDTLYGGRHLALKIGALEKTPGYTVNRLCGSGIQAIVDAGRLIQLGEADCVLASGAENMSMVPHLVYGSRFGTKYGPLKSVDMLLDALTDQYVQTPMGITAENLAKLFKISRQECDQYSWESHKKASTAYQEKKLQAELCSIELKRGVLEEDGHMRKDVSLDEMNNLRPTFDKNGTVTAGSASGIVDGAASVIIASETFVEKNGLTPLCEILGSSVIGVDPKFMGIGPSPAIKLLLEKMGKSMKEIDLFEINEAFAPQTLACIKDLELPQEKLNVWGGAIAIGHPLAATGTRISLTLARQLQVLGGKIGIASACIGGGQGIALMLKRVN